MFKLLGSILVVIIFSLLIWQRFDVPPSLEAMVTAVEGSSTYEIGDDLKRGIIISTQEEYLLVQLGDAYQLALDRRTQVELEDLTLGEPTIRLQKGRIQITSSGSPIWITTNQSESTLAGGTATLVNYDFLEEVHIIPLEGSIQVHIKKTGEYLSTPVPIGVHEGYDVSYERIDPTLYSESTRPFYVWVEQMIQ